ncbi:extended synaptotagmin-3-like protein [Labeo rohita]|uniref:Extended synaptotagmin-3-like protein n=1 Tax=Labeo rohita TaxID=84645 RepID=A0A498N8H6_LABRO|nr:extended synaptotagmin-3-like protein [Labeo rohita]
MIMEFLIFMMRAIVLCYPVYLTGSLGLSISWILLSMLMWTMWKNNRRWKGQRIDTAIDFVENEKEVISTELTMNMPAWILQQAWPFFGMYMEKLLIENIQPSVRASSPHLKTFTFTKVHMGQKAPTITGVRVYTHELETREVILDLNIIYDADVDIDADVKPAIKVGVKGLQALQINWTGMTNVLDGPGLSHMSESAIVDIIASLMVLPNRMCIPLIDQVKVDQMKFPLPRGVVRVHVLEARDLVAKDTYMMGLVKGKSDPYTVLRFVIHEAPGQELEVELYDEDTDADDFLGRYSLDCGDVRKERELDEWFTLEDIETGEIHMKLQWFSLSTNPALLKELTKRTNDPNSYVEFSVDQQSQKSKVVYASKDPSYDECFTFFVHSVNSQVLNVEVKEHEKKSSLGKLTLPLVRLLNMSDMTIDQRFQLERSGANSQIRLKAVLRILTLEKPKPKVVTPPDQVQGKVSSSQTHPEPQTPAPTQVSAQPVHGNPQEKVPVSFVPLSRTQTVPVAVPSSVNSYNELQAEYAPYRRSTFVTTEPLRSTPSTPSQMRRYDSHSLLSDNSIASSRYDLTDNVPYPEAILNHQGSFGQIQLTLRYATLRKRLIVIVSSCRDLFACSENGSDTYVRMYLLPDQTWKHRKRTPVKKKTVNPVFNETFEFAVSLEEAKTRKLDVAVKNNKMLHKRERKEIGMVLVDMSEVDLVKGSVEWYELTLPGLKKIN